MAKITSVIARESNGNIQITFTIPYGNVEEAKKDTLAEMAKDVDIPGFRKGKAPLERVKDAIPEKKIIEHALGHILPKALGDVIEEHKLKLVIYPKFELVSADSGKDWQIRGVTCELPNIELGDYKNGVIGALRASNIVVPGKESPSQDEEHAKREQTVISTLLETIKVAIPQILIEEEADSRLSNLLSRLEKLGLTLESYLASIKKTPEDIRAEYLNQAKAAIALDLILTKVAEAEGLTVEEKELEAAAKISEASQEPKSESKAPAEETKRLLESILKRRKALDFLINLS
jgi:FKBP-type peptidyl-prolyl cis-trans isomerase (trigger factor)